MQGSFIAGGGHFWKTGSGFLLGSYSGRSSHSRGLGDMQCFHTCSLGHSMGQHWEGPIAGWGRQLQGMGLGLCIPAKCLFLVWKSDYLPQSTSSFPTSCIEFDKHLFSFFLPSCSYLWQTPLAVDSSVTPYIFFCLQNHNVFAFHWEASS